jgi:hypothetical protein
LAPSPDRFKLGVLFVKDAASAVVTTMPGDLFHLTCKICHERFRVILRGRYAYLERDGSNADCDDVPGLDVRLPLAMRRFVDFATGPCLDLGGGEEVTELEPEMTIRQDLGIVGSYVESTLMTTCLDAF